MTTSPRRIGLDLGGTKCLGVALDDDGTVVDDVRRPTPRDPSAVIETLAEVAEALGPASSIGVGVPGLVTRDGVLRAAPNLVDVADLAVGHLLPARLGRPVVVDNDATCAVVAEWQLGAGRGVDDLILVTLGTGIGGGIVAGGRLQRGVNGFAGEFGHMVVDPSGPPCVCGRRGCWERYASGAGLARLAQNAVDAGRGGRIAELAGAGAAPKGEHVLVAAREGDAGAMSVVDEFSRWTALGLVNLTNALDPEMFVLGGGLAMGADLYLGPIRYWFGELLYSPDLRPHPRLEFAQWDERAGAVGAAVLGAKG